MSIIKKNNSEKFFCILFNLLFFSMLFSIITEATEYDVDWWAMYVAEQAYGYLGNDYELGGGHNYYDYVQNAGNSDFSLDCSGLVNCSLWDAGYLQGHDGFTVATYKSNNDYFFTYDVSDGWVQEGDIVISANGSHMGLVYAVDPGVSIDIIHASGGSDEVKISYGIDPETNSFWGEDNGAIYRGVKITPAEEDD